MRKDFGANALSFPQAVYILGTYNEDGTPNAMNAAWGGFVEMDKIALCLSPHKTTDNILARKEFTISFGTEATVLGCDYVGLVSGNDKPDKLAVAGLTAEKSENIDAPLFKELPMALECVLDSYDEASMLMTAKVLHVVADESILDEEGKIEADKFAPIIFDPCKNVYRTIGPAIANAFADGMKLEK